MTTSGTPDLQESSVRPLHTSVAGRARLEVKGLYRFRLKRQLEQCLDELGLLLVDQAKTRTGRLLVVYPKHLSLAVVLQCIAPQLQVRQSRQAAAQPAAKPFDLRYPMP